MAEAGTCSAVRTGIGAQQCIKGNPLKMFRKFFLGVPGFSFDTFSDYQDQSKWNEAIAAGNIFPLENIEAVDDASTEESVVETDGASKIKTRDGRYGFIVDMNMTLAQNKVFQGYDTLVWTLFIADDDDNIIAYSSDDTTVSGMTISYMNVMPMKPTLGTDDYSKTRAEFQLQYNNQMNEDICVALGSELDWSPVELQPVTVAILSNVSIATNTITLTATIIDDTIASLPTVPVTGAVDADFQLIDQTSAVLTPTTDYTVTETSTPGTYTIDATAGGMTSGTVQLIASADSLFESDAAAVTP